MKQDPIIDEYVTAIYAGSEIRTSTHAELADAIRTAEVPYLKLPRRWCHGPRDIGHWTLVEVIGSTDVPTGKPNELPGGIVRPGPLAIVFVPHGSSCCDYHEKVMRAKPVKRSSGDKRNR